MGTHDATGRSKPGRRGRDRRVNGPPQDEPWVWMSRGLLESPAWAALSLPARRVIDRVLVEHMAHGGAENGNLPVSYDDFVAYGVRRNSVAPAIAEAVALGLLDHQRGRSGGSNATRRVQVFRLTWLRSSSNEPPTNRWKRIKSPTDARKVADTARGTTTDSRRHARQRAPNGEDIDSSLACATMENPRPDGI